MNAFHNNGEVISTDSGLNLGVLEIISILGFAIVGASTFLNFTPVVAENWRASGVGLQVMIGCLAGAVLMLRKNYFAGFFIAVFSAFFLTHEIIIVYDNKAVEMGRELGLNGWFRPVLSVYENAFSFKTGAFWALTGIIIALFGICIGWFQEIRRANNAAGIQYLTADKASDNFTEVSDDSDEIDDTNNYDSIYFTDDPDNRDNNDDERS